MMWRKTKKLRDNVCKRFQNDTGLTKKRFVCRGEYRTQQTSKMELLAIIFNDLKELTIIAKSSILDFWRVLNLISILILVASIVIIFNN